MKNFTFFLLLLLVLLDLKSYSFPYVSKAPWNIKAGFFMYPASKDQFCSILPTIRVEGNYKFSSLIETGVYGGIGLVNGKKPDPLGHTIFLMPFYGININFHFLPLLVKKDDLRFDCYVASKFGGHYCKLPKGSFPSPGNMLEYGIGLGAAYYFGKSFGIFAEYSYGEYDYFDEKEFWRYANVVSSTALRYGITFKIKSKR